MCGRLSGRRHSKTSIPHGRHGQEYPAASSPARTSAVCSGHPPHIEAAYDEGRLGSLRFRPRRNVAPPMSMPADTLAIALAEQSADGSSRRRDPHPHRRDLDGQPSCSAHFSAIDTMLLSFSTSGRGITRAETRVLPPAEPARGISGMDALLETEILGTQKAISTADRRAPSIKLRVSAVDVSAMSGQEPERGSAIGHSASC